MNSTDCRPYGRMGWIRTLTAASRRSGDTPRAARWQHGPGSAVAWRFLCLSVLTVLLTGWCGLVGPAAAAPPPNTGSSLRILNWNLGFTWVDLPGVCGSIDINAGKIGVLSYEQRAQDIVQAILQTDNDVVVLNEVFSDPVRAILVNQLKANGYPNYIAKIYKQRTVEIANILLMGLLGPVSLPCQDFFGLSPTTTFEAADSGLMIFIKQGLRFTPFTASPQAPYDVTLVEGRNEGNPWGGAGQIAVQTFNFSWDLGLLEPGECYFDDCLATKAVAMVRILNSSTGTVSNIAFSHAQAWNDPAQVQTREAQFKIVKDLMLSSLTPTQLAVQPVYLTGDLNVPGENKADFSPTSEWTKLFNSAASSSGNFFACGLGPCTFNTSTQGGSFMTDSWGFQTSTEDPGITNADDNARLDYFVHNHSRLPVSVGRFCVQHVMRGFDLEKQVRPLSDHLGLRADVNRQASHCSPNDDAGLVGPKPITLDINGNFGFEGSIAFRGGMQWLKIDAEEGWGTGSYVFSVIAYGLPGENFSVDFDVYEATDLSRPIAAFRNEQQVDHGYDVKYVLPTPPYYIRVFARHALTQLPDRTLTGTYTFYVHENRGLSPNDAIGLDPAAPSSYPWPALQLSKGGSPYTGTQDNITFTADTEVWYEFYTNTSSGGAFPQVDFLVENSLNLNPPGHNNPPFTMKLRSPRPGYPVLASVMDQTHGGWVNGDLTEAYDYDRDGRFDWHLAAPNLRGNNGQPQRYFLTLKRLAPAQLEIIRSVATFRTTLTFITSRLISVLEEFTWGDASDNAFFQWAYDNAGSGNCGTIPGAVCYGGVELDDDYQWGPTDATFAGSFASFLTPNIWDHGLFTSWTQLLPRNGSSIMPMHRDVSGVTQGLMFTWGPTGSNPDDSDTLYWYVLHYCLSHKPGAYCDY